jgi:hypothetical protein
VNADGPATAWIVVSHDPRVIKSQPVLGASGASIRMRPERDRLTSRRAARRPRSAGMDDSSPLAFISVLMAMISTGVAVVTLVVSRKDRRDDERRRMRVEQDIAAVDEDVRERVEHASTPTDVQVVYEQAEERREALRAEQPVRRPLSLRHMILAASLAAWSLLLAIANRRDVADSDVPVLNVGVGIVVGMVALVYALRGFREARPAPVRAAVWALTAGVAAAGIITCFVALDGYNPERGD